MISVGSTSAGAAICTGSSAAQSAVSRSAPERPASSDSQVHGDAADRVVAPIPVTTTRVFDMFVHSSVVDMPHPWRVLTA